MLRNTFRQLIQYPRLLRQCLTPQHNHPASLLASAGAPDRSPGPAACLTAHYQAHSQTACTAPPTRLNTPPTPCLHFSTPTEIVAFSDRVDEFRAINTEVVGVSVDSQFTHLAFASTPRNKGGLGGCKYPLLSDLTKQVAKDYGVLIEDGEDAGVALR